MSGFRNYVCWMEDRLDAVFQTAALDADEEIFRFTHSPVSVQRRDPTDASFKRTLGKLSEKALLTEIWLKTPDHLSNAVVGDQGTGKSHLIKWIYRRVSEEVGGKNHIILISRHASNLRKIIELIIKDFDGDVISEIRRQIETTIDLGEGGIRKKILNDLSLTLDPRSFDDDYEYRNDEEKVLCQLLPKVLKDSGVESELLSRGEGSILANLAKHVFGNRKTIEDLNNECRWTAQDLTFDSQMIAGARSEIKGLVSAIDQDEGLKNKSLDILNKGLAQALPLLAGIKKGSLIDAFREIRRHLKSQGKSLYLFIEDVSTLQGLEGELLEIINVKHNNTDNKDIAPLFSMLGFTREFIRDNVPDNLKVRFSHILDFSYDAREIKEGFLAEFASRYLNAVRYSKKDLAKQYKSTLSDSDLKSACTACPHKEKCHEAFGVVDGRGLYPFTEKSLAHLYSFRPTEGQEGFNPRRMSDLVLKQFLDKAEPPIRAGDFPDDSLLEAIELGSDMPADRKVDLNTLRTLKHTYQEKDGDRVAGLISIYGDPAEGTSSLSGEISLAFGIEKRKDDYKPPTRPDQKQVEPKPQEGEAQTGPDEFDKWLNSGEISQGDLGKWREQLLRNVKANFAGDFSGYARFEANVFLNKNHIKFEGQRQKTNPSARAVSIDDVDKSLTNAIAMRTLIRGIRTETPYEDLAESLTLLEGVKDQIRNFYDGVRKSGHSTPLSPLEHAVGILDMGHRLHKGDLPKKKADSQSALFDWKDCKNHPDSSLL
ncbi:MAG: hypothetical protein HN996_02480, partial [Opitutae bacterium]|nr:hypothetical protein [Opitutae bacterium]